MRKYLTLLPDIENARWPDGLAAGPSFARTGRPCLGDRPGPSPRGVRPRVHPADHGQRGNAGGPPARVKARQSWAWRAPGSHPR